MNRSLIPAAAYALLAVGISSFGLATAGHAATQFDGNWHVTLVCPKAPDGTLGYTFRFIASVSDGILHGQNGIAGTPTWLSLEGRIQNDGTSVLAANGLTGDPRYAVGQVPKLSPVRYHVNAHFDATRGSGTRVETRRCDLTFEKL